MPTFDPRFFKAIAKLIANVDLPTPPLALEIAIVNFVPLIGFLVKLYGAIFCFIASLRPAVFLSIVVS